VSKKFGKSLYTISGKRKDNVRSLAAFRKSPTMSVVVYSFRENENAPSASTFVNILPEGQKDGCPSGSLKGNSRAAKFVNPECAAKKVSGCEFQM
jgi:hypothetical protein